MRKTFIGIGLLMAIVFVECKSGKQEYNKSNEYNNNNKYNNAYNDEYNKEYDIAIIETTGSDNKSSIYYYNNDLELLSKFSLPYGTMGNIFYNPVIFNNKFYTIPQGLANKKDLNLVIEFSLDDGNVTEYEIEQLAMNSLAVNSKYIYTCNTENGISYINQYTLENDIVTSVDIPEIYISKLMVTEDDLYAFGTMKGDNGMESYLYILDPMLTTKEVINITSSGSSQYKALFVDNYLFFSNLMDKDDKPGYTVSRMSLNSYEIENISLSTPYPSDLLQYYDYLIIAHCNLVTNEGNSITFYSMKDESMEEVTFNHPVTQINIKGDYLYIFDGSNLYQYVINKDDITELELIKKIEIDKEGSSDNYNYISGFYIK